VRIARRRQAWEEIRGCANEMPQLGVMIEGRPVPSRAQRRREAFTPAVHEILPTPTDRQRSALDVALNTQDIALIQGPPGTGKTRVIAALQARLADKDEVANGSGLAGNTLLTSFQHDAVENAAMATRVLGLPAIKIGYRRGWEDSGDGVTNWAAEMVERVRAVRAELGIEHSIQRALREVRRLTIRNIEAPGPEEASLGLLNQVQELAAEWLPIQLNDAIDELRGRLCSSHTNEPLGDEERAFALRTVRGLRTEVVPFSDDGPTVAHKVLSRLKRIDGFVLGDEERLVLERTAEYDSDEAPEEDLLNGLRCVRDALIDRLQDSTPVVAIRPVQADVSDLCGQVVDALALRAKRLPAGVDTAVDDWLEALDHDPQGIRETIAHYSMVLAATCQQSVGKDMVEAKSGDHMIFRSVIVDEAARANPLDLLIPMALAKRRIILVGDHRQLPHVLEPDIERELAQSIEASTQDALKRSLFERLFHELREREQRDGVKRTVTLDTQYRMHRVLGEFISAQFYAPYGEALASVRPDTDFTHSVVLSDQTSLSGLVAAWIQVPCEAGAEDGGRSKCRPIEADRIVREARIILERHPDLSVGVISFYARQRDAILKAMIRYELTEPDDGGGLRIRDQWERTMDGRERLRVGTVDAFQGKEFDVVLLSLTRSNRIEVKNEETRRKRYGFLLLENRLCVAMSRQQRLLIVLGDPEMVRGEEAEQSLPALAAFAKLCEEGVHGRVVRT